MLFSPGLFLRRHFAAGAAWSGVFRPRMPHMREKRVDRNRLPCAERARRPSARGFSGSPQSETNIRNNDEQIGRASLRAKVNEAAEIGENHRPITTPSHVTN